MSHHEGVSCDSCLKNNFRGKRYKCLICYDYDLCATCHDNGTLTGGHSASHPMQCILTRNDLDLYFAGELVDQSHSFTCPFCGKLGFTDASLYEHVNTTHADVSTDVVCPICATLPGGEPNQITDDFLTHLNVEHQSHIVRIRPRHHMRGSNNNRSRRSQFMNSNGTAVSSNARDAFEPIVQLLSQLSDFDRQSTSNRLPLERVIRRPQQPAQLASTSSGSAAHSETLSSQQMPYMVLLDSTANSSSSSSNAHSSVSKSAPKYLLSTCTSTPSPVDLERDTLNALKTDRSLFVEEMIIASLSEPLNIDTILATKTSTTVEEVKPESICDDSFEVNADEKFTSNTQPNQDSHVAECDLGSFNQDSQQSNSDKSEIEPDASKPSSPKPWQQQQQPSVKCLDSSNVITPQCSLSFGDTDSGVQQKSLPKSLIAAAAAAAASSPFIVSNPLGNHRASRGSKVGRANPSLGSGPNGLTSLSIRSSLTAGRPTTGLNSVVSPTGRRKVTTLKHTTTEPSTTN